MDQGEGPGEAGLPSLLLYIKDMNKLFLFIITSSLFLSCTSHYYIVRHAERLDNSANSPLSTAGFQRADVLRDSLGGKGIDSILVTTFLRTQQTAAPLATLLNKTWTVYAPDTTQGLVTALRRIKGKSILVVGHSNIVPAIVLGLSGTAVPAIADDDFDNLYHIRIRKCLGTNKKLWHTTYGTPTP